VYIQCIQGSFECVLSVYRALLIVCWAFLRVYRALLIVCWAVLHTYTSLAMCEGFMQYVRVSIHTHPSNNVTHIDESCHADINDASHVWIRHGTHVNEAHVHTGPMSHT